MKRTGIGLALCLGVFGFGMVGQPQELSAQENECEDCVWILGSCYECEGPADWGWFDCVGTCQGWCEVGEDCEPGGDEEDLLALAAGTFSNTVQDRSFLGEGDEEVFGQVTRDCQGRILTRYYPADERKRIARQTSRITL